MGRRIVRGCVKRAARTADQWEVMDRISYWLCPTEHHRARALEAGARVRTARTMAAAACGLSLLATAPFVGWWFLVLFGVSAVVLGSADRRLDRSPRPELVM